MSPANSQVEANQANALKPSGTKAVEVQEKPPQYGLKPYLSEGGAVVPAEESAEVDRRFAAFRRDFLPMGETGDILIRRMAILSVRMDRSVTHEFAAVAENVAIALDEFEAPEDADEATIAKLRKWAADLALFDPSKEACLARQYEAAASRGFFRSLKELQLLQKQAKAEAQVPASPPKPQELGSSLPVESMKSILESLPTEPARIAPSKSPAPSKSVAPALDFETKGSFFVPISVGRAG